MVYFPGLEWLNNKCDIEFGLNFFVNVVIALLGYFVSKRLIPRYGDALFNANVQAKDQNRHGMRFLPEGLGIVTTAVYIICIILFIPFMFLRKKTGVSCLMAILALKSELIFHYFFEHGRLFNFDSAEFILYVGSLLSISFIALIGFADDVMGMSWKQRTIMSAIASVPLLMVYYSNFGSTLVCLPFFLEWLVTDNMVSLGIFFYVYLMISIVYCTNTLHLMSGLNGLEAGQAVVICLSIITLNFMDLYGPCFLKHSFSIFLMFPFLTTSLALLKYSWYPAQIGVGSTYCYVAGMAFSVVAILGDFNCTLLWFFLPQTINFFYSLPQLFGFLPRDSRNRLPRHHSSGLIEMSFVTSNFRSYKDVPLMLRFMDFFRLIDLNKVEDGHHTCIEFSNLTLYNLILKATGPIEEKRLSIILLLFQIICCSCVLLYRFI